MSSLIALQLGCGARSERRTNDSSVGGSSSASAGGSGEAGGAATAGGADGLGAAGSPSSPGKGGTGGTGAPGGAGGLGAVGGGSAGAAFASDDGTLEIPVAPRSLSSFALALDSKATGLSSGFQQELPLAFGSEYPQKVTLDLAGSYLMDEDARFFDAASGLSLTEVSAISSGIDARSVDAKHFEIDVVSEGDFTILLAGTWSPSADDEPPAASFRVEVSVPVRRVSGVALVSCASTPAYVVSGAPFRRPYFELTDADGAQFRPLNASGARSVPVSVHAKPGTLLSTADGIGSLVAVGEEQTLTIRSGDTEIGKFELVAPARVDGLDTEFTHRGPATRGPVDVVTGSLVFVRFPDEHGDEIHAVPKLSVAGVPVCSEVVPEWFSLASSNPDVCSLESPLLCDYCHEDTLPTFVNLDAPGTCHLVLDAPELNGGQGLREELSLRIEDGAP